jgi:hypothetical protein
VVIAKFVKSRSHEPSVEPQGFLGGDPCGIKISFSPFFSFRGWVIRFIIFLKK